MVKCNTNEEQNIQKRSNQTNNKTELYNKIT